VAVGGADDILDESEACPGTSTLKMKT